MKKIKLSIVGLLLSGMCYGQCVSNYEDSTEVANETLKWKILNIIEYVQYDMYYGYITRSKGEFYIRELVSMLPKTQNYE